MQASREELERSGAPAPWGSGFVPPDEVGRARDGALGVTVQTLVEMGFPLERALHAHAQFGDELDTIMEYLTAEQDMRM